MQYGFKKVLFFLLLFFFYSKKKKKDKTQKKTRPLQIGCFQYIPKSELPRLPDKVEGIFCVSQTTMPPATLNSILQEEFSPAQGLFMQLHFRYILGSMDHHLSVSICI